MTIKQKDFYRLCVLMESIDASWGDSMTPEIAEKLVQAATAAALERAAEVCDGINADYTARYVAAEAKKPYNLEYLDGASDGAEQCAEAIRALKESDTC